MKKGIIIAFLVLIIDQITKYYVAFSLFKDKRFIEVTSFFNLVFVKNTGISFSLFADSRGWEKIVLLIVVSVIILWLCYWMYREKDAVTKSSLGMIIGGAIGNLLDRFTYGGVVDFLDFHIGIHHWPAFNIADSAICVGAIIMVVQGVILMKKDKE